MLSLLDNRTAKTARTLQVRAEEAAQRYLGLSFEDVEARVASDFPASHYWKSGDTIAFHYEELPDFSFMIVSSLGTDTLSIQAGGRFDGFMLQHSSGRMWTSLSKPLGGRLGPKAKGLATRLEKEFGIKDARAVLRKFGRSLR